MVSYQFFTVDVFTDRLFGGNPLAVFTDANGLTSQQMQKIAREFNLSETVFVLPPRSQEDNFRLRIFTPKTELEFAGHPTIGAAFVLKLSGQITLDNEVSNIFFEEGIGTVPVKVITREDQSIYAELTASKMPEFRKEIPPLQDLASLLGLESENLIRAQTISCGLPFLFIQVKSRKNLAIAKLNIHIWQNLLSESWASSIYVFTDDVELASSHIRSRMFAPGLGIEEDPATGSAATALAGFLLEDFKCKDGLHTWQIEQGFEMNRPSILLLSADISEGKFKSIRVGGTSVLVTEGKLWI